MSNQHTMEITCTECGEYFPASNSYTENRMEVEFCSRECRQRWRNRRSAACHWNERRN